MGADEGRDCSPGKGATARAAAVDWGTRMYRPHTFPPSSTTWETFSAHTPASEVSTPNSLAEMCAQEYSSKWI